MSLFIGPHPAVEKMGIGAIHYVAQNGAKKKCEQ